MVLMILNLDRPTALQMVQARVSIHELLTQAIIANSLNPVVVEREHGNLQQRARDLGYEERVDMTRSNGDCMYDAVADQMALHEGRDWWRLARNGDRSWSVERAQSSAELRRRAESMVRTNPLFAPFRWDEAGQAGAGRWGDMLSLYALAEVTQRRVRIISSRSDFPPVHMEPMTPDSRNVADGREELVIGHIHEMHYVSLQNRTQ
jgi:hypothetical protein